MTAREHLSYRIFILATAIGLLLSMASSIRAAIPPNAAVRDQETPAIWTSMAPDLQHGLEVEMKRLGLGRALGDESLAVALVDLTTPSRPRVAAINGDVMMYAASLPKIAILLGAFQAEADGRIELTPRDQELLAQMIRRSSNSAASEMFERVGPAYLADVLSSPGYRLYDPSRNGGLWVGKAYGRGGLWRRDPLHNLSHGATPMQVAQFYYLLETGRLVDRDTSQRIKQVFLGPVINHKFVKALLARDRTATLFRKSGTWKNWHSDSALVKRAGHRYIAVALSSRPESLEWLSDIILAMDDLVVGEPGRVVASAATASGEVSRKGSPGERSSSSLPKVL
jgi:beta-lactamase class A